MSKVTLHLKMPGANISKVFTLMKADDTPCCELIVKSPAKGEERIELKTDASNAEYFRNALSKMI